MPRNAWRVLRTLGVALAAWAGYLGVLGDRQDPKLIPVAAAAVVVLLVVSIGQRMGRRSEKQIVEWANAQSDPPKRAKAIEEARRSYASAKGRNRVAIAHSLVPLLVSAGELDEAEAIAGAESDPESRLALQLSLVESCFGANDPARVKRVLAARKPTTDVELEQHADLLEALADVELGRPTEALEAAERALRIATERSAIEPGTLAVRISALDALERRGEAQELLRGKSRDELIDMLDFASTARILDVLRDIHPEIVATEERERETT